MVTVKVTDETFDSEVLGAESPVLVDFWAEWCGPCRMVAPILEQLSDELDGALTIAKVNVDEAPKTALRYRIQSIPTMVLFQDGEAVEAVQGALPKQQIKSWLARRVPGARGAVIEVEELDRRLKAGESIALFDLRREQDWARSHLKRSEPVDPDTLESKLKALPSGSTAVLIDRTGELSTELAARYRRQGLAVSALGKGLLNWEGSGKATFSSREEREEAERTGSGS